MKRKASSSRVRVGRATVWAVLAFLCWIVGGSGVAPAQMPNRQCGDYVEAYRGGPVAYGAYLQVAADVAKSRDAQEGSTRYSKALQASSTPSNALWLSNWCKKNPLRGFTEASSRLLDELTGQASAPTPGAEGYHPAISPPVVIVAPPPPPSSCRAREVGECTGCAATCGNGSQATCMQGRTWFGQTSCQNQASCSCVFPKNAGPPPPGMDGGPTWCRVGKVGECGGCSISCNGGATATCDPGQVWFGQIACRNQASCNCK
jgi:hypothetical protein